MNGIGVIIHCHSHSLGHCPTWTFFLRRHVNFDLASWNGFGDGEKELFPWFIEASAKLSAVCPHSGNASAAKDRALAPNREHYPA